jgi:predicted nucleic acid-binding protein
MLGALVAFSQLCKRAQRIIVHSRSDKELLSKKHGYKAKYIVVMDDDDLNLVDWGKRVKELKKLYKEVVGK